ncbi:LysR family transcriptional regulator [Caballeronia hypogeia]|uniref:LysR family transcriptional regulator n=1 Tax=Caballeronia hypogeia TaxID=1777140 RepID=A0A158DSL7_9BURK|nr:LysR family transcriptional regulator [Caballeronia hypogeia]
MRDLHSGPQRGRLRVLSTHGFGLKIVAPLLNDFHARYPEIALELLLSPDPVDFSKDRIDLWFREGSVEDRHIEARQLMPRQLVVCASPAYARTYGLPQHVDDLVRHRCINFRDASGTIQPWSFKVDGLARRRQFVARHTFNDESLITQAVIDGVGIAQLPAYHVCGLLAERTLLCCLAQYAPKDGGHYLCYPKRTPVPARVRVFIEYMTERMHALNLR